MVIDTKLVQAELWSIQSSNLSSFTFHDNVDNIQNYITKKLEPDSRIKKITMNGTAQCLWMVQSMPFSFSFPSFLFFSDNLAWAPSNILCSLLQKCCILAGVITDTHSYHFEQKAVHINRRYLVPMLNLQCAQIKIILISPMCEFHRRNKFDQDTIHM